MIVEKGFLVILSVAYSICRRRLKEAFGTPASLPGRAYSFEISSFGFLLDTLAGERS